MSDQLIDDNLASIPDDAFLVASDDDLYLPLHSACQEAIEAGRAAFYVVFEPGTVRDQHITLLESSAPIAVHVLSRGPQPVVLQNCPIHIQAGSIFLHNIVVTGCSSAYPLQLIARAGIHARRLIVLDNTSGDPPPYQGGALTMGNTLRLQGWGDDPPVPFAGRVATFEHCWFLRNCTYGPGERDALLEADHIERIAFDRCLFADNEATTAISHTADQITFDHCLVHETRLRGLWLVLQAYTRVAFQHGWLATTAGVLKQSAGAGPPEGVKPVVFTDARLSLARKLREDLVALDHTQIASWPTLPADLTRWAFDAGRPDVPDLIAAIAGEERIVS